MKHVRAVVLVAAVLAANVALAESATDIIRQAGVTGGLVVHVGCGDGTLTAALCAGDGYIVQGLDTSAENVAKACKAFSDKGLIGRVTARTFDGQTLPYRDNMVNLVVADAGCGVPRAEILRVLAPNGVAWIGGEKQVKPRPSSLDEWTHYQHDPQGTMVSLDQVVGPPRGIQWMGGPKWLRNHDFMSSMHALVATGGRIFYVIDEGLRNHIFLPSKWVLIARDAFNGTVLWRRNLKDWYPNNWPLKSGPGQFPRRLVAVGNMVFVTFGQTEPLTAIDAVTGKTIRTYESTKATEEILFDDGVLYLLVNPSRKPVRYRANSTSYKEIQHAENGWAWTPAAPAASVMAVDAATGRTLWKHADKVAPLTLTVGGDKVFFANGEGIVALDRKTGDPKWTSDGPAIKKFPTGGSTRAVYADGILMVATGTKVTALSAKDGKQLWTESLLHSSHHCPNDLFLIDGLVWSANTGTAQRGGTHLKAINFRTGEVAKDFKAKNLPVFPMHPRCYPSRATTRYLITNGMGCEFYPVGGTELQPFNYIRGSCIYGLMPCNGLLYKPPDSCCCYYQSKLDYFCALSAESGFVGKAAEADRLEKGPAYRDVAAGKVSGAKAPWPMYRGDIERSGCTSAPITGTLASAWTADLGGKLTPPVLADGKVFVAQVDFHRVHALDAATGRPVWTFVAGGRVDSSPTFYAGTLLFGCADGWVYCLRASDGALAWRYLVAPADRQIVSLNQVESLWPVHGSVLVVNGSLYALAGRNVFFDGGVRMVRLDAKTGKMLAEHIMDDKDPDTGKNLQALIKAKYMPIANTDILSSDGQRLYMQEQNFDLDGKRLRVAPTLPKEGPDVDRGKPHLFCQTGLLDDVWFHRSYMIYGNDCGEGWGDYFKTRNFAPCGRLLVFDDTRVYGYRSEPLGNMLQPRTTYKLYACPKSPAQVTAPAAAAPGRPKTAVKAIRGKGKPTRGIKEDWEVLTPGMLVNAMVLAKDRLILAGPPDVADETKMLGFLPGAHDEINRQLQAQDEAWRGKRGGLLRIVSAKDGSKQAEYRLDGVPVFDGMAVGDGKVLISLGDGRLVCFGAN